LCGRGTGEEWWMDSVLKAKVSEVFPDIEWEKLAEGRRMSAWVCTWRQEVEGSNKVRVGVAQRDGFGPGNEFGRVWGLVWKNKYCGP
jgi:hypothetical protein